MRDADDQCPSRFEDAAYFGNDSFFTGDMFQYIQKEDAIKTGIGQWQGLGGTEDVLSSGVSALCLRDITRRGIHPNRLIAFACKLQGSETEGASQV